MATEFKRLSDVNVIESMSNSTNVLIEENGEIVKMSGNKIIPTGMVKSVNGVTPDAAGNVVMSGLPEGGEPYQQLVTDGEGNAKWEDRLGYVTEPVETVLLDEENLAFTSVSNFTFASLNPDTLQLIVGNVYKVVWNGQNYDCTCKNYEPNSGTEMTFLGNGMVVGLEDSGEPFCIASSDGQQAIYDYAAATTNSVHVTGYLQEIVKIPDEFVPNKYAPYFFTHTPDSLTDATCKEIYEAFIAGRRVMMQSPGGGTPYPRLVLDCFWSETVGFWAYIIAGSFAYYVHGDENNGFEFEFYEWFDHINAT